MGDIITLKSKPIHPGINIGKWKSTLDIATALLYRLKEIRLLKRIIRKQDGQLKYANELIAIQRRMINLLKAQVESIDSILGR